MEGYSIRRMKPSELRWVFRRIKRDFPRGEYPPYAILYFQLFKGILEGWLYCDNDNNALAYAICSAGCENGHVLISLMAVLKSSRGQGIGSGFLGALKEVYSDKQSLIAEVERPDLAGSQEENNARTRRIDFYKRAGYELIPGIEYSIWDVPMHLMSRPVRAEANEIARDICHIMRRIYLDLMGEAFIHKLKIRKINGQE